MYYYKVKVASTKKTIHILGEVENGGTTNKRRGRPPKAAAAGATAAGMTAAGATVAGATVVGAAVDGDVIDSQPTQPILEDSGTNFLAWIAENEYILSIHILGEVVCV